MKKRINEHTHKKHRTRKGTTQENFEKTDDAQKLDVLKTPKNQTKKLLNI